MIRVKSRHIFQFCRKLDSTIGSLASFCYAIFISVEELNGALLQKTLPSQTGELIVIVMAV